MFQPRSPFPIVCAALIVFSLCTAPSSGQATEGSITGVVRSVSGDQLPGATITILNQETGTVVRSVVSGVGGAYSAAGLAPGLYAVTADLPSFRRVIQRDRRLGPGLTLTVDFTLELRVTEQVTVTAMKREETVLNTPVSVTAPTEEVLRERGAQNIEDVAANVANFSVQNLGPGQSTVALRGVSSGQIARDQPGVKEQVGAYLDESVISLSLFTPDMDLFDMTRVEVLRGPQGTLFGSGSVGGTVRYISNQPQLGVSSVFGEIGGNTVSGGGQGGDFKVGLNTPLGGLAALRIAGYYNRLAGWMDAVEPNLSNNDAVHPGYSLRKNVNTGDREGVRVALTIAPDENLTITPRFVYQKEAMEGWNRIDNYNILANPFTTTRPKVTLGDSKLFIQLNEPFTDKFTLADLNIKYDFGPVALTSITSFTNRDVLVVRDATALTGSVTGGTIGLSDNIATLDAPLYDATRAKGWTQELRLSSGTGRLKWVGGGFYSDSTRRYNQNLPVKQFTFLSGIPTEGTYAPNDDLYFSDINYKSREIGVFGEGTFAVTDKFSLTGGLRYYSYKVDKALIFDGLFGPDYPTFTLGPGTTKANGWAPRFIASYKVSNDTTINAQASKGFRLGGFNDPILKPLCSAQDLVTFGSVPTWKDETAWNYEIGSKSRIMGGRGSVNASAFYVDVRDLQVVVTAGTCSSRLVFNVPRARSVGGELEFALAPNDHFDFSLSGGYNDSEVRSTLSPAATVLATGIQAGNRLPSVPKFQANVAATYQQPVAEGFQGYLTGNYQHIGSRYTQLVDQEPGVGTINLLAFAPHTIGGPLTQSTFTFNPLLPAYDIVNVRIGVRHNVWDTALYVNNLTNERALLALDRERGLLARQGFLTNQPRTIGITTRVDF
jgi:iron complex outermembrane recepter protein